MKIRILNFAILLLFSGIIFLSSCEKKFEDFFSEQFPEPNHTSTDIMIDGEIAAPILNTSFTLGNFIPTGLDSSLWVEVDDQDIIHLRMYFKNIFSLSAANIYLTPITVGIPADSNSMSTDSSKLKLYENALSGHLFFNNPIFKFIIRNQIPVVTFFKIDTLRMHSPVFDTTYIRSHHKYYINAPQQTGLTDTTIITIDKTVLPDFENFFSPIPR